MVYTLSCVTFINTLCQKWSDLLIIFIYNPLMRIIIDEFPQEMQSTLHWQVTAGTYFSVDSNHHTHQVMHDIIIYTLVHAFKYSHCTKSTPCDIFLACGISIVIPCWQVKNGSGLLQQSPKMISIQNKSCMTSFLTWCYMLQNTHSPTKTPTDGMRRCHGAYVTLMHCVGCRQ